MARQVLPTATELANLNTLTEIREWTGLDNGVWMAVSQTLGTVPSVRVLATLPQHTFSAAVGRSRVTPTGGGARELTAVEILQAALMWRVARQAYGLDDIDPLVPVVPAAAAVAPAAAAQINPSPTKRVKMSGAIDQLDETEIELLSQTQLDQAYRNYREAVGADPMPDADPSAEQITAMFAKVVTRQEAPYADFSVLTPYGRRSQKQAKARNFLLQPDGTWKTVEIPGPPFFSAWCACWKVYRTVLLMLRHPAAAGGAERPVVTVAALEEYMNKILELNDEFPEAWHLVMQAEDRCRGEQFERYKRDLVRARLEGRLPMSLVFNHEQPWVGVFCFAARNQEFWNRMVIRPAQTFLARGGAGKSMSRKDAEDIQYSEAASSAMHRPPGEGTLKTAVRKRRDKEQIQALKDKEKQQNFSNAPWNAGKPKEAPGASRGPGGNHPRKSGREFQTDRDGNQICFAFAKAALGACPEPCQNSRSHCCQYCLGSHPNAQCPKAPARKPNPPGQKGK